MMAPSGRASLLSAGIAAILASGSACGEPGSSAGGASGMEVVVEGTIRQVGALPNVVTRLETDSGAVLLAGPLSEELARAAGAVARIRGQRAEGRAPPAIRVLSYELREVDGLTPRVGVLELQGGELLLRQRSGLRLVLEGGTSRMRDAAGSKVWVTTREDGRTIIRWGILAPRSS